MNLRKTEPAAVADSAQPATLSLRRDATDVLLVMFIETALVGIYLLRGAARVRLWYLRFSDSRRRTSAPTARAATGPG
jgi:hypothetical protein